MGLGLLRGTACCASPCPSEVVCLATNGKCLRLVRYKFYLLLGSPSTTLLHGRWLVILERTSINSCDTIDQLT